MGWSGLHSSVPEKENHCRATQGTFRHFKNEGLGSELCVVEWHWPRSGGGSKVVLSMCSCETISNEGTPASMGLAKSTMAESPCRFSWCFPQQDLFGHHGRQFQMGWSSQNATDNYCQDHHCTSTHVCHTWHSGSTYFRQRSTICVNRILRVYQVKRDKAHTIFSLPSSDRWWSLSEPSRKPLRLSEVVDWLRWFPIDLPDNPTLDNWNTSMWVTDGKESTHSLGPFETRHW